MNETFTSRDIVRTVHFADEDDDEEFVIDGRERSGSVTTIVENATVVEEIPKQVVTNEMPDVLPPLNRLYTADGKAGTPLVRSIVSATLVRFYTAQLADELSADNILKAAHVTDITEQSAVDSKDAEQSIPEEEQHEEDEATQFVEQRQHTPTIQTTPVVEVMAETASTPLKPKFYYTPGKSHYVYSTVPPATDSGNTSKAIPTQTRSTTMTPKVHLGTLLSENIEAMSKETRNSDLDNMAAFRKEHQQRRSEFEQHLAGVSGPNIVLDKEPTALVGPFAAVNRKAEELVKASEFTQGKVQTYHTRAAMRSASAFSAEPKTPGSSDSDIRLLDAAINVLDRPAMQWPLLDTTKPEEAKDMHSEFFDNLFSRMEHLDLKLTTGHLQQA